MSRHRIHTFGVASGLHVKEVANLSLFVDEMLSTFTLPHTNVVVCTEPISGCPQNRGCMYPVQSRFFAMFRPNPHRTRDTTQCDASKWDLLM